MNQERNMFTTETNAYPNLPCSTAHVVCIPCHGNGILWSGQIGRIAVVQLGQIESNPLQSPRRRSVSPGKSTPNVLMTIQEYRYTVLMAFAYYGHKILQILLVVDAGTGMFHSLPGEKQTIRRVSPTAQTRDVSVSFVERKGPADKVYILIIYIYCLTESYMPDSPVHLRVCRYAYFAYSAF